MTNNNNLEKILSKDKDKVAQQEHSNDNFEKIMKGGSRSSKRKNKANSITWGIFVLSIFLAISTSPGWWLLALIILAYMYFQDWVEWIG